MATKTKPTGPSTLVWTGQNRDEMVEFCGLDNLFQPRANIGHFWDGSPLLSVWNQAGETTYPVRIGETVVRDEDSDLTVLGPSAAELAPYERRHNDRVAA